MGNECQKCQNELGEMTQLAKVPATKLKTRVCSPGPIWWKERNDLKRDTQQWAIWAENSRKKEPGQRALRRIQ